MAEPVEFPFGSVVYYMKLRAALPQNRSNFYVAHGEPGVVLGPGVIRYGVGRSEKTTYAMSATVSGVDPVGWVYRY
jgi:hypothetical protein